MGAGFEEGWVEMLELNELVAAKGTKANAGSHKRIQKEKFQVFQGITSGGSEDPRTPVI